MNLEEKLKLRRFIDRYDQIWHDIDIISEHIQDLSNEFEKWVDELK